VESSSAINGGDAGGSARFFPILMAAFVVVQVFGAYSYAFLRSSQLFGKGVRLAVISLALQVSGVALGCVTFGAFDT
jgi:hypothetical protein